MTLPRKYIQFTLTARQLELVCAVIKSHISRLKTQTNNTAHAGVCEAVHSSLDQSGRLLDLMLHSLLLDRMRTRLIVTESQFATLCHAIAEAKRRIQARVCPGSNTHETKLALLAQLSDVEDRLANANHDPTRFDISGADAFRDTVLGTSSGALSRARLPERRK